MWIIALAEDLTGTRLRSFQQARFWAGGTRLRNPSLRPSLTKGRDESGTTKGEVVTLKGADLNSGRQATGSVRIAIDPRRNRGCLNSIRSPGRVDLDTG